MAYYFLFSEKDTTIYSHPDRTDMNTGGDEILEIVEEKATTGNSYYASRVLIQFKNTELKDVLENRLKDGNGDRVSEGNWSTNLQLFTTENNKNLSTDHIVEVYPLSQSWNEGTQRYDANPPTTTTGSFQAANGATWIYRTESTSSAWITSSFGTGATGSYTIQEGGGNWYTGSEFKSSQDFFAGGDDFDLNLDVTNIVKKFSASYYQSSTHPTGLPNRGFIIKKPTDTEEDNFGSGYLQYFSTNTHTIYPPKLTFKWDDSSYSPTVGTTTLSSGDIFLTLHNNKATFQRKSKQRFRLTTRKRYPDRTFTTSSNYLDTQYLPAASYYSLRDAETDEVVIPFDTDYTKLSADSEGMYFDLFMEGLQPERYYKLMFRSDNNDGVQIFDEDYFFKVIR
jgi:hypothetical protein